MEVKLIQLPNMPAEACEDAARMCYDSADKKKDGSAKKLLNAIVSKGHNSVLEFADATFEITGVSRALLAQFTRHRHLSFNVRSQRYVKEDVAKYVTPPNMSHDAIGVFEDAMSNAWDSYRELLSHGVKAEDARFVLPNACQTQLHVKGSLRAWKEWLPVRLDRAAQWEIRAMANKIEGLLMEAVPEVFFKTEK